MCIRDRIDYGFGAKKPIVDVIKDIIKEQSAITTGDPNAPPYLNFSEYLTKTRGNISPYRKEPPNPAEKELNQDEKVGAGVLKAEADVARTSS